MKALVDPKRSYQETALRGATPLELVVTLYDTAIQDMRRALTAMRSNDIETRAREIGHALIVLQQLQGTLDFERGGSAARQFEQFYSLVRAKLLEAQIRDSPELLHQQMNYFSEVRDCWVQVRHLLPSAMSSGVGVGSDTGKQRSQRSKWSA